MHQVPHLEGLTLRRVQRLGQQLVVGEPQEEAHAGEEPEDAVPARVHVQPASDDGRDGRGHAEVDRDLRHHPLRIGRREHVADDGARDHDPCAGRQALQGTKEHELPQRTTGRRPKLSDSAP